MKVFLVEDDAIYGEFIAKALLGLKFDVQSFGSAEECLEAMNGKMPEVLIVDYKLPGMNGIELFDQVKSRLGDETKFIILSSIEDGAMVLNFIKKGIRDYVIKDEQVVDSLEAVIHDNDDFYFN
jgi:DNA-binding NtrC family response regulator